MQNSEIGEADSGERQSVGNYSSGCDETNVIDLLGVTTLDAWLTLGSPTINGIRGHQEK